MKSKTIVYTVAALALAVMLVGTIIKNLKNEELSTKNVFMLDTYISMTAYGKGAEDALEKCVSEISSSENIFSAYKESSETYKINLSKEKKRKASEKIIDIVKKAIEYSKKTNGKFDITIKPITDLWKINDGGYVPDDEEIAFALKGVSIDNIDVGENFIEFKNESTKIDLGGIAKGYLADACADILESENISNALLDFGGNICALGKNPKTNKGWGVGIKKPFGENGEAIGKISCSANKTFVVTSGAYERNFTADDGAFYHHIFDAKTGRPFNGIFDSVTVISDNCTMADAFSTALFMCDINEAQNLAKDNDIKIVLIAKDKTIYTNCQDFELLDSSYSVVEF